MNNPSVHQPLRTCATEIVPFLNEPDYINFLSEPDFQSVEPIDPTSDLQQM